MRPSGSCMGTMNLAKSEGGGVNNDQKIYLLGLRDLWMSNNGQEKARLVHEMRYCMGAKIMGNKYKCSECKQMIWNSHTTKKHMICGRCLRLRKNG